MFLCFNTLAWITENVKFRWNSPDKVVNLHHDSLDTLQSLEGSAALCFFPLDRYKHLNHLQNNTHIPLMFPFGYFWEQTENIWVSILEMSSYQCFGLRPTHDMQKKKIDIVATNDKKSFPQFINLWWPIVGVLILFLVLVQSLPWYLFFSYACHVWGSVRITHFEIKFAIKQLC